MQATIKTLWGDVKTTDVSPSTSIYSAMSSVWFDVSKAKKVKLIKTSDEWEVTTNEFEVYEWDGTSIFEDNSIWSTSWIASIVLVITEKTKWGSR